MRFLSWLDAVKSRITTREGQPMRRRMVQGPVAGQLEGLESRSLLSATALLINNELNVISDSNENIQVSSVTTNGTQTVRVLINGIVASTVESVPTTAVTSIVVQGGNLQTSIDLSSVGSLTYPNLAGIKVDAGHGADTILGSIDIDETLNGNHGDDLITCQNGDSTVLGGDGNDTIIGAGGNDSLLGEVGNDSINGGTGNDTIDAHDGNDTVDAGAGNDSVIGGDGEDSLIGGLGNDTLNGMMGLDTIDGGAGNDVIFGGAGNDSLTGGAGNDSILGNDGFDTLEGGTDNDTLDGGADGDSIVGSVGDDSLIGAAGNDTIQGNDGDDTLLGGAGRDLMEGNAGDDQLKGQSGSDTMYGGAGFDLLDGGTGNDFADAGDAPIDPPQAAPLTARLFAIADDGRDAIVELNPSTGAVINRFAAPEPINASGDALAYDGKSLFFLNGFGTNLLFELNPDTGIVLHATEIPRPSNQRYDGLAALAGMIYIQDSFNDDILVFDPASNGVVNVIDVNVVNPGTNLLGGLAGILDPDRLVATVAGGRSVVEINPLTGLITNSFTPTTESAGTYAGVGVVGDLIFLGGSHVVAASPFGTLTALDIFSRSGQLQKTMTLPFAVSAFGGDDVGNVGVPLTDPGQFDIVVNLPASVTTSQRVSFDNAEAKWESIIKGDLPDVVVLGQGTIDDLVVKVNVHPIDGLGGTLGQTVINVQRQDSLMLPALATIDIDSADLAQLEANGLLEDTILHELGHALGFGTIWIQRGLLVAPNTTNPRFLGSQATTEYDKLFHTSEPNVPVENVGGPGSANAHWRESKFGNELMSSSLNTTGNPLSRVTIASMADLGYQVDINQADQYAPPPLGSTVGASGAALASTVQPGRWLLPNTTRQFIKPLAVAVVAPTTTPTTTTPATPVSPTLATINFNELSSRPVDGVTVKGAQFDYKVDGFDSTDATFGSVNGPTVNTTVGLLSPVLEGGTAGVLTVDFAALAKDVSFAVARKNADSLVVNGVQVTLYDASLNVISTSTVVLSSLKGTAEGSFAYTGTTGVSRVVLDFTIGALVADGDRFSIDNFAFDLAGAPGANLFGGDTLIGGDGDDVLVGREGNDLINGGAGNDTIDGGDGRDNIFGGAGNDSVGGGSGNDTLRGSGGKDTLFGNAGNDLLIATTKDGIDLLNGNEGSDTVEVRGTTKQDLIEVGQSVAKKLTVTSGSTLQTIESDVERVQVLGLGGNDRLELHDLTGVSPLELQLDGGNGNDRIIADAGTGISDIRLLLIGAAGNDSLVGTDSGESLLGGDGNDTILGNGGNDTINGGAGDDSMSGGAGNDVIGGGTGIATIDGGDGNDSLTGGLLNDVINGGSGNDTLIGLNGDDALNGMDGNDSLDGGSDNDSLLGGAGNDSLDGGTDNDTLDGQDGNDHLDGGHGNDIINGGNGDDTILGDDGNDTIFGESGNDLINGGDGNDLVLGNDGDDVILGSDGNDTLKGGAGRDTLLGGNGNDNVDGQGGSDTVSGNQGTDIVTGAVEEIKESFQLSLTILAKLV